jgi:hypothetical protein
MNRNFTTISTIVVAFSLTFLEEFSMAQGNIMEEKPAKSFKSYNTYKAPLIEDNSFFVEEAFNQSAGVIQFISTCYFDNINSRNLAYSFTQEIPLQDVKHQISYTINYIALNAQSPRLQGLGDFMVNYRYELKGKDDWALITPRFSLIIPTGDFRKGFGIGAWGGQFNLPLTKMVSNRLVFHYNTGFTFLKDAQFSLSDATSNDEVKRKHLTGINIGASMIWMPADKLNLMLESVSNINDSFDETGKVNKGHQLILNPGLRYAFDIGKCQIVPGISIPVAIEKNTRQPGAFIYLSIEPNYTIKK